MYEPGGRTRGLEHRPDEGQIFSWQLAALLGGTQQQSVKFQPAQLLQVQQALAHMQQSQVAEQQAALRKRIDEEAQKKADALVEAQRKAQVAPAEVKNKNEQTTQENGDKDDVMASQVSGGGRSQGAKRRRALRLTKSAKEHAKEAAEQERDELQGVLNLI